MCKAAPDVYPLRYHPGAEQRWVRQSVPFCFFTWTTPSGENPLARSIAFCCVVSTALARPACGSLTTQLPSLRGSTKYSLCLPTALSFLLVVERRGCLHHVGAGPQ